MMKGLVGALIAIICIIPLFSIGQSQSSKEKQGLKKIIAPSFSIQFCPSALLDLYTPMYQVGIVHTMTKYSMISYEGAINAAIIPCIFAKLNQNREAYKLKISLRTISKKPKKYFDYQSWSVFYKKSGIYDRSSFFVNDSVKQIFDYNITNTSFGLLYGKGKRWPLAKYLSMELEIQLGVRYFIRTYQNLDIIAQKPFNENFLINKGNYFLPSSAICFRLCFDIH